MPEPAGPGADSKRTDSLEAGVSGVAGTVERKSGDIEPSVPGR
jgi:hypothetical protein